MLYCHVYRAPHSKSVRNRLRCTECSIVLIVSNSASTVEITRYVVSNFAGLCLNDCPHKNQSIKKLKLIHNLF